MNKNRTHKFYLKSFVGAWARGILNPHHNMLKLKIFLINVSPFNKIIVQFNKAVKSFRYSIPNDLSTALNKISERSNINFSIFLSWFFQSFSLFSMLLQLCWDFLRTNLFFLFQVIIQTKKLIYAIQISVIVKFQRLLKLQKIPGNVIWYIKTFKNPVFSILILANLIMNISKDFLVNLIGLQQLQQQRFQRNQQLPASFRQLSHLWPQRSDFGSVGPKISGLFLSKKIAITMVIGKIMILMIGLQKWCRENQRSISHPIICQLWFFSLFFC